MATPLRWLAAWACLVCACSEERVRLPQAPVSGGSKVRGDDRPMDGGSGDDRDGGTTDAGDASVPATSCERVPAVRISDAEIGVITATSLPLDFLVTRQAERWTSNCADPELIIELSDGTCPEGFGHQLSLAFSLNDLADGVIHTGNNAVYAERESSSITIRYTRPEPLEPAGTWGTCTGASGQVIFDTAPDATAGGFFAARYQLGLTNCGETPLEPITVNGMFRIQLRFDLRSYCPTRSF